MRALVTQAYSNLLTATCLCCLQALDCFLAGDDVPKKKPDPSIYTLAARRLGVQPAECLVVEDSAIGLQVTYITAQHGDWLHNNTS